MDLQEFSKSKNFDLLSKSEQEYYKEHGTFKNKTKVREKLSKYFYRVSFTGRGKKLQIKLGKPKAAGSTELDTALVKTIVNTYEPGYYWSFSKWLDKLNIIGRSAFELDKQIDKVEGVRKSLLITFGNKLHAKQRDFFTKSFTKAAKSMGGEVITVKMGAYMTENDGTEIRELEPEHEQYLAKVLEQLRDKGIKSPIYARKQDEYKAALDKLKLRNSWTGYAISGGDDFTLAKFRAGNKLPSADKTRDLFKREFRKWLRDNIDKAEQAIKDEPLDGALADLIELGIMTEKQVRREKEVATWYRRCLIEGTTWKEYKRLEPYLMGERPYTYIKPPLSYDEQ